MKTLVGVVLAAYFIGAISSVFAWSFFGHVWWLPTGRDEARAFIILIFHAFGLAGFPLYCHIRAEFP